jgi:flagellar motor switch protein FliG
VGQGQDNYGGLTGPEKAEIFMVAVGEEHFARLFAMMDDNEIREFSQAM